MVLKVKIDYINRLIDKSLSEGDDTIEFKGKFIGGCDIVKEMYENKELHKLLGKQ